MNQGYSSKKITRMLVDCNGKLPNPLADHHFPGNWPDVWTEPKVHQHLQCLPRRWRPQVFSSLGKSSNKMMDFPASQFDYWRVTAPENCKHSKGKNNDKNNAGEQTAGSQLRSAGFVSSQASWEVLRQMLQDFFDFLADLLFLSSGLARDRAKYSMKTCTAFLCTFLCGLVPHSPTFVVLQHHYSMFLPKPCGIMVPTAQANNQSVSYQDSTPMTGDATPTILGGLKLKWSIAVYGAIRNWSFQWYMFLRKDA